MVELTHLVAIVSNQIKKTERFIRSFHVDIDLPSKVRLFVHDIASTQPTQVAIVILILFILNLEKSFFCIFVVTSRGRSNTEVPVEIIII